MKFIWVAVTGLAAACGTTATTPATTGGNNLVDVGSIADAGTDGSGAKADALTADGAGVGVGDATASQDSGASADVAQPVDTKQVADGGGVQDAGASQDAGAPQDAGGANDAGGQGKDIVAPPGSCKGKCGKYESGATCQCDSACKSFDDCCADFQALCTCAKDEDCASTDKCKVGKCNSGSCTVTDKCDDENPCTDDSCDATSGACKATPKKDASSCSDGDSCTTGDKCTGGKCAGTGSAADGAYCSDGDSCTSGDKCVSGKCAPGEAKVCDDESVCTVDSCDPVKGCTYTPGNEGKTCDDGNACTDADVCAAGKCKGKNKPDGTACEDGNPCTTDSKCTAASCKGTNLPEKTPCDDENACTEEDDCSAYGSCYGTSKSCDDGNDCTTDSCDKATGNCKFVNKSEGAYCSDGESCTTKDACKAGKCVGEVLKDGDTCSDGIGCTKDDKCTGGKCTGVPDASKDGTSCSDSDPCTTTDKCSGGVCQGVPDEAKCDDGNACTADTCVKLSAYSSKCENKAAPEGGKCDDGDPCTGPDTCKASKCSAPAICSYTSLLEDAFECGKNDGWVFEPAPKAGVSSWGIDDTPADPVAKSPKCSLNFNNGKDYEDTAASKGTATSKEIALPADGILTLSFWSYHGVETSTSYDNRQILISADGFATTLKTVKLDNAKNAKAWTLEKIDLTQFKGKKVKIRFDFDSKDTYNNTTPGWFIDDLKLQKGVIAGG